MCWFTTRLKASARTVGLASHQGLQRCLKHLGAFLSALLALRYRLVRVVSRRLRGPPVGWPVPDELTCRTCEFLSGGDLASFSATARELRRHVERFDGVLWRSVCLRRWQRVRFNPLRVYDDLAARTWRERFILAERDGKRTVARCADIQSVKKWLVKDRAREPYIIDNWPYRANMLYTSPTFAPTPVPYVVLVPTDHRFTYIQVSGLPRIRVKRAPDWGWELVNATLTLKSVEHAPQPADLDPHYPATRILMT